MLTPAQNALLQHYVSMPEPNYAELFAVQAELAENQELLESANEKIESLEDDARDFAMEIDSREAKIREVNAALADALYWLQELLGGECKAFDNKEFNRLWQILD